MSQIPALAIVSFSSPYILAIVPIIVIRQDNHKGSLSPFDRIAVLIGYRRKCFVFQSLDLSIKQFALTGYAALGTVAESLSRVNLPMPPKMLTPRLNRPKIECLARYS